MKQNVPLITVVTVVLNDAAHIEPTLLSVLNQTYPRIEYIVIDGGSTDGTVEVIKKYAHKVAYWISEPDRGLYDAMNKAIDRATGEWINFMNSNDQFYRDDAVAQVFSDYPPESDFIYGRHVEQHQDFEWVVPTRPLDKMWQRISFSHQSLFARTRLMKCHKFDLRYRIVCDYEFYFSHYIRGFKFYNSHKIIAVVSTRGIADRNIWRRTFERWNVVSTYQKSMKVHCFYLWGLCANILLPLYLLVKSALYKGIRHSRSQPASLPCSEADSEAQSGKIDVPRQSLGTRSSALSQVSVIIPNYNNAPYLETCLESVLRQSYKNLDIVIIDDHSTDHSQSILQHYETTYPHIRVLYNAQHTGNVGLNRHRAILAAGGDYITTLDSDDCYLNPFKIEKEMQLIQSHKQVFDKEVLAFSDVMVINKRGKPSHTLGNQHPINEGQIFLEIISRQGMIPRDFTYYRHIYFEVGGYDPGFPIYEDWDLKIRIAAQYEYYYTGIIGTGYNCHGRGLSNASPDLHRECLQRILAKNIHLVDESLREEVQQNVAQFMRNTKRRLWFFR